MTEGASATLLGPQDLVAGLVVRHAAKPDWGLGKILQADDSRVAVYFKDAPGTVADAVRVLARTASHLTRAETQRDVVLDHLPPFIAGKFPARYDARLTEQAAIEHFIAEFISFESATYLRQKRQYTEQTHQLVAEWFTGDAGREQLATGAAAAIAAKLSDLMRLTNLLTKSELSAFEEMCADADAAAEFARATLAFVATPSDITLRKLVDASTAPSSGLATKVSSWQVLTALPSLARPRDCVWFKPDAARRAAELFCFDVLFDAKPTWASYQRLMWFASYWLAKLQPLGARDFIDVTAFFEETVLSRKAKGKSQK